MATSCLPQKMNGGAMSRAGSVTAALPQIAAPWAAVRPAVEQVQGAAPPGGRLVRVDAFGHRRTVAP